MRNVAKRAAVVLAAIAGLVLVPTTIASAEGISDEPTTGQETNSIVTENGLLSGILVRVPVNVQDVHILNGNVINVLGLLGADAG